VQWIAAHYKHLQIPRYFLDDKDFALPQGRQLNNINSENI
jgi:hypothetical protein